MTQLAHLPHDYAQLQQDFNAAVDALKLAMVTVAQSSHSINASAAEISSASDDLAQRTSQQAANLEETAAAVHEITTAVHETAKGASTAETAVRDTKSDAEQAGKVVDQAIAAMGAIALLQKAIEAEGSPSKAQSRVHHGPYRGR